MRAMPSFVASTPVPRSSRRLVSLGLIALLLPSAAHADDIKEVAARVGPSVVHLELLGATGNPIGNGTGFFISESGLLVTNHHVIEPASDIKAVLGEKQRLAVEGALAIDETFDLAILKVAGDGFPAVELGDSGSLEQGSRVFVIGSPMGLSRTLSEGLVSAIRPNGVATEPGAAPDPKLVIQTTADISPGSSGSPVLDESGKVVGVAVAIMRGGENIGFAIPVNEVRRLHAQIRPDDQPQPLRSIRWHNLVFSAAALAALVLFLWLTRRRRRVRT